MTCVEEPECRNHSSKVRPIASTFVSTPSGQSVSYPTRVCPKFAYKDLIAHDLPSKHSGIYSRASIRASSSFISSHFLCTETLRPTHLAQPMIDIFMAKIISVRHDIWDLKYYSFAKWNPTLTTTTSKTPQGWRDIQQPLLGDSGNSTLDMLIYDSHPRTPCVCPEKTSCLRCGWLHKPGPRFYPGIEPAVSMACLDSARQATKQDQGI
ncbi:hypothetical protein B0T19DRAFT_416175 [Cercophora scortea]|uniref:Uncharacterized protein n=1 Tax=Cercophora scortea TaxID=314031 RepID=A0AAE0IWQ9_9PEZI|nr:hypothetical protein B0T19DRAFT_416175 [Cercophora scortea]